MQKLMEAYRSTRLAGLVLHVVSVWAALGASIWLLAMLGSDFGASNQGAPRGAPWTPPGAVIGAVWSILYALMGAALWRANRAQPNHRRGMKTAILVLVAFCLVWPFYAFDTSSRWPGLLGNLGVLALALNAVRVAWPHVRAVARLLLPTAVWITIATASILDGARRYGW